MNSASSLKPDQSPTSEPNGEGIFHAKLSEPARPPRRWLGRRMGLCLVAATAIPLILYWLPAERANWRFAAAQAKWLEDDLPGAIQILDEAAREFPDNTGIYAQRIQFYLDAREFEKALADAERLRAKFPKSTTVLGLQIEALHRLGRHDEATAISKELLRLAEEERIGSRVDARNMLAYAQAISNKELSVAAEHMSEALRLHGDHAQRLLLQQKQFSASDQDVARAQAAYIDTDGYVHLRLGDNETARAEFETAVALFERLASQQQGELALAVRSYNLERWQRSNEQTLAVLLYHRSLAYDRLDLQVEAALDRERVRKLGYEPNEQLF